MIAQEPVQAAIWFSLNHYAYQDAIFLAERLFAEVASEDALYLLATCYYQSGKANATYSILGSHDYTSPQCRYLFSRSCFDLKKFCEAEEALIGHLKGSNNASSSDATNNSKASIRGLDAKLRDNSSNATPQAIPTDILIKEYGESAAFAAQLMGLICIKTCRNHLACEYLQKSLEMNPFLFRSFELLIELGAKVNPSKVFSLERYPSISSVEPFSLIHGSNPLIKLWSSMNKPNSNSASATPLSNPIVPTIDSFNSGSIMASPIAGYFTPPNMLTTQPNNKSGLNQATTPVGAPVPPVIPTTQQNPVVRRSARINTGVKENTHKASSLINPVKTRSRESRVSNMNENNKNNRGGGGGAPIKRKGRQSSTNNSSSTITSMDNRKESEMNEINRQMQSGNGGKILTEKKDAKHMSETQQKVIDPRSLKSELNDSLKEASDSASDPEKPAPLDSSISSNQSLSSSHHINLEALILSTLHKQRNSAEGLLSLLAQYGRAWSLLGQFHCPKAIDELSRIEYKQRQTGWVLVAMGRAYFEMGKYEEACKCFERVRQLEPHRLQGMEYYSTALWHLQREKQLSTLAQDLIEFDRTASQTWCAAGNCFSLQKEHETAIKFLHRAIQVDPDHAYAYTLLGHELVLTEEMEQAMAAFRSAMRLDQRHYNAWYGLGMIYYKQEKYTLAEMHYMKALKINPYSPVLMCHLGVVRHALKKSDLALQTLDAALQMDQRNALCKFHRASIYFALDKHQKALKELEELKQVVPKESLVYFLIGKVHKKMGNTHLALMNFSWAMDLDPKGANNQIKEVIDKQYAGDDEESVCVLPDTAVDTSANISDAIGDAHNDEEDDEEDESNGVDESDIRELIAFNAPPIMNQEEAMQPDDDDPLAASISHNSTGDHESRRSVDMSEELPDQSMQRVNDSGTSVEEESFSLPALDVHMDDSADVSDMISRGLDHGQPGSALDILQSDTSDVISIDNDGHNHHGSIPSPSL